MKKQFINHFSAFMIVVVTAVTCMETNVFEKNIVLKNHEWEKTYKPEIQFTITDTSSAYNIFFVLRHTDAYHYNNLWVKLESKAPGAEKSDEQQFDLPLAIGSKWNGVGMDDIFEHRILLYNRPVKFSMRGTYTIKMQHIMRENPLQEVMNIGLRLEKVRQK